jgi:hypothetical protein
MEQKIYNIVANNVNVPVAVNDNMNLSNDLGAKSADIKKICHDIEQQFNIKYGTFDYLTKYFDKLCVSDLVKLTRSEVLYNQLYVSENVSLGTKIRRLFQKQH